MKLKSKKTAPPDVSSTRSSAEEIEKMSLSQALEFLQKKYGPGSIRLANTTEKIRRVSSGCWAVDFALGGGLTENRLHEFNGRESSFKTTLSLAALAEYQRTYDDALGVYVDLERTFERKHAKRLGVDLDRLLLIDPDDGEQAANELFDALRINAPLFAILDSLAALRPRKEHEADLEDQLKIMGLQAKLCSHVLAGVNSRLKRSRFSPDAPPTIGVVINQLREKVGLVFGDPTYTPGGRAKDHYYSVTIRLRQESKPVTESVTIAGQKREVVVAKEVNFSIRKNKVGGPQDEADSFVFHYRDTANFDAYTFNNAAVAFRHAIFHELIKPEPVKVGKSTKLKYEYGNVSAVGEAEFVKELNASEEAMDAIYFDILGHINSKIRKEQINA